DRLKADRGAFEAALRNETLLMLFAKPSTRTRISFETGMTQLGGHAIFFGQDQSQLGRGEPISDTAKVASRYVDGIMARLFEHDDMLELAEHADVPVLNGLTDFLHPHQALADLYTLRERGLLGAGPVAFVGDGNNVAHSLMQACATMDVPCRVATPDGMSPDDEIVERVSDADVTVSNDPQAAVEDAVAVYTDVWVSMGEEDDREEKLAAFEGFQVTPGLMDAAAEDVVFMHCLPAHRGEEVAAEVIDGPRSVVFDQAENRMHVQKAVMATLMR
ncbi:MAG: ornithine carbamoyltransferase, partial [Halobacteriales archaeon]